MCFPPCFIPINDAVFRALKIAKWIVLFFFCTNFGCLARAQPPISRLLNPQNPPLYLALMPGNPVYHTPFCPLGYPQMSKWGSFTTHHVVIVLVVFTLSNVCFYPRTAKEKAKNAFLSPFFW